uniref:Uncharacterized protein n=1 Tax=Meloidogyne enterolobii TaxID=390850 RepID=A0A6V7U2E7_MELEN|nr:unnamed protein product [Meloidogyne enterolobii]
MSKDNLITACAFVNDKDNFVLQKVLEHLTANSNENKEYSSSTILHLNTKYYICDVPVFNFNSFEDFTESQSKQKDENLFLALIVCAFPDEINEHFLDKLSQISQIESLDVKTLIIKNWTNSEGFDNKLNSTPFDFAKLNKFALTHNIEIINVFNEEGSNNQPNDSDDEEEEMGTKGIARIVEVLETVKWNGIKLKPNPIKNIKHKKQFLDYIKEIDDEEFLWEKFEGEKIEEKKTEIKMVDYPDTEDEEAILEWFDRPLTRNFKFKEFPLSTYSQHQSQYNNTQNMPILRSQPESIQQQNVIRRRFDGTK